MVRVILLPLYTDLVYGENYVTSTLRKIITTLITSLVFAKITTSNVLINVISYTSLCQQWQGVHITDQDV